MSSDKNPVQRAKPFNELRLGYIASLLFQNVQKQPIPHNIDLLDFFFPGMIVLEMGPGEPKKTEALFSDTDHVILAVRNKSGFYTGGSSTRVSQIVGRLIGTAKSGIEKERRAANLIQKRVAAELIKEPEKLLNLWILYADIVKDQTGEAWDRLIATFAEYINAIIMKRAQMSAYEKENELFAFDDETFNLLMDYVLSEWNAETLDNCINAFTWLVFGALMRNEVRRLLYAYESGFAPRATDMSAAEAFAKDSYTEYYYEGDDLDKLFPGIEWYCDRCGAYLNEQDDFDDHNKVWKCTCCGYTNQLTIENIYDSEEDYQEGGPPTDAKKFFRALKERTEELEDV
jgi:hypothetical protein